MNERIQQFTKVRRYLFGVLFVVNLVVVGSLVNARYDSAVEMIAFTLIGATVVTVVLSLLSIPLVLLGVWVWNKFKKLH